MKLIVSCEHAGNQIPAEYRFLFSAQEELLQSHQGYDPGALDLARAIAAATDSPLFFNTTSRLLVDANRSVTHPALFSAASKKGGAELLMQILQQQYYPYRRRVSAAIDMAVSSGETVLHIAAHSFTPVLHGRARMADVGLLYDPDRAGEKLFCRRWREQLLRRDPQMRVRRNYPYRGKADGLTSSMRRLYAAGDYLGIELEINQKHFYAPLAHWEHWRQIVVNSLLPLL